MASDLLSIGKSGARVARQALDVTSNNIANAGVEGYVRRSAKIGEVQTVSLSATPTAVNLSGARITGIVRNADMFRQSEVRRTGSDAARASAEVDGLTAVQSALEDTGVYDAVVEFEASLQQLASDPTSGPLRADALEQARGLAQTLNTAATGLDAAGKGIRFQAQDGVDSVNKLASDLVKVNQRLSLTGANGDQTKLLDQRDLLLEQLSGKADITTTFNADNTVSVMLGGPTGAGLVTGGSANALSMTATSDGTVAFAVASQAVTLSGGAIAGHAQALVELAGARTSLDTIAAGVIATVNDAQANGVDLNGNAGQALFSGSGAGDIKVVAAGGSAIATAPAGAAANSRDASNLASLRTALTANDPAGAMDTLLYGVSSAIAGRSTMRDALASIAGSARSALDAQSGVNLDDEAVNLVRFQQAYQASARVMQVASDLFDSILAIR